MHSVNLNKNELLNIVRKNLDKHVAEFAEAVEDYKTAVLKIAQDNLKLAKKADLDIFKQIKSVPAAPTSYEDNYKRAIRMLELSVDEIIELDDAVFNQLVLDEWAWKQSFTASNMAYKSLSARSFKL